jgi:hypothetical protein
VERRHRRIKQHLVQLGLTPAAAQKVIDKLGGVKDAVKNVPKLAQLKVEALGANEVLNALALIDGKIVEVNKKKVTVRMTTDNGGGVSFQNTTGTRRRRSATGGLFRGKGGPTEDANTARISNGEFIVRAARTKRFRALLDAINSGSERAIQTALASLSGAGQAVSGIATAAASACSSLTPATCPARRGQVTAARRRSPSPHPPRPLPSGRRDGGHRRPGRAAARPDEGRGSEDTRAAAGRREAREHGDVGGGMPV